MSQSDELSKTEAELLNKATMAPYKEVFKNFGNKDWRIRNLYKIKDRNSQLITFKPNRAQNHFLKHRHSRNVVLKSRRLGFTTLEVVDMLDDTLFTPNFDSLFISYDKESALSIYDDKVMFAWDLLYPEIRNRFIINTERANQLKLDFGKSTSGKNEGVSSLSVKNRGRSGTFNRLHVSEMGKISKESKLKEREIIAGTIPTVPINGRVDIESTAEGDNGAFYEMFWEGWNIPEDELLPMQFKSHFYNWMWDDEELARIHICKVNRDFEDYRKEYNEKHAKHAHGSMTERHIAYYFQKWLSLNKKWEILFQEYPSTPEEAFTYAGTKLFSAITLEWQKLWFKRGETVNDWTYFKKYRPNHTYVLGADVAEGVGQDSSTITIIDLTLSEVVAVFKNNKIAPDTFAHEIVNGGNRYGGCLAGVERNNHGHATLATLKHIYHNIFTEKKEDRYEEKDTEKLGWHTNKATKPMMMFDLNDAMEEQSLKFVSQPLYKEALAYDKEDVSETKFDPDSTKHFDLLMSTAIAWQMRKYVGITRLDSGLIRRSEQRGWQDSDYEDNDGGFDPYAIL